MKKLGLICWSMLAIIMLLLAGCRKANKDEQNYIVETLADLQQQIEQEASGYLKDNQKQVLAFGAFLATRNRLNYDSLGGTDPANKENVIQILANDWGITDQETAIKKLEWLKHGGRHLSSDPGYFGYDEIYASIIAGTAEDFIQESEAFEDVYQALQQEYGYTQAELSSIKTVAAWDYDCLVVVARWCYLADYVSEGDAWSYIDYAAEAATIDYDNWRTYFAGVLFGRAIWAEEGGFDADSKAVADHLLLDSTSVYQTYKFK